MLEKDSVGNIVNHDMVVGGSCVCLLLFRSLGYGLASGGGFFAKVVGFLSPPSSTSMGQLEMPKRKEVRCPRRPNSKSLGMKDESP